MAHDPSISLTPEQQSLVDELVASGRYHDVGDVVRAGLRLLEQKEAERKAVIAEMEKAIAEGLASGPATDLDIEAIIAQAEAERQKERR